MFDLYLPIIIQEVAINAVLNNRDKCSSKMAITFFAMSNTLPEMSHPISQTNSGDTFILSNTMKLVCYSKGICTRYGSICRWLEDRLGVNVLFFLAEDRLDQ